MDTRAMGETAQLLNLVGDIYDAVLDRTLWPTVLRSLSAFIGGAASAVYWKDAADACGDVYFEDGGIAPHFRDLYFNAYVRLNPTTIPRLFAKVEEPIATADLCPYDEFLQTRFYREWAEPQGLVDFVSVTLEKSAAKAAMFGVFRHARDGVVDEAARRRMRLLAPHVRRAVLISKVVDFSRNETAMFGETLDSLQTSIFLVDPRGRIMHANVAGRSMLSKGYAVHAVDDCLAASEPDSDRRLRSALLAAAEGDRAIGDSGIALSLTGRAGERYVAHTLPLTSQARGRAGRKHSATAALFVHEARLEAPPATAIADGYGLTVSETRVLFTLVEVGSAPEVAKTLGIAPSTVKTHLKRVYQKTGAARQADLVKLVAGFTTL